MKQERPNCYKCVHRREIPGDAHSSCAHPNIPQNPLGQVLSVLGRRAPLGPVPITGGPKVTGKAHGIRHGWFNWPFNFDPVWLESCTGFEEIQ